LAARIKNTPGDTERSSRYYCAIRCLRCPAVQKISGPPFAAAPRLDPAGEPARHSHRVHVIQLVVAAPCSRYQERNPPGMGYREEGVQHDPVHAVIPAIDKVPNRSVKSSASADRRADPQLTSGHQPYCPRRGHCFRAGEVLGPGRSLRALLDDRATPEAVDDIRRQLRRSLECLVGVHFTEGNAITVLRNGDEIFPAMLEAIRKAQYTVDLMTFVYWKGRPAQQFADALCDRRSAGAEGTRQPAAAIRAGRARDGAAR
jgi:hypothetical protein